MQNIFRGIAEVPETIADVSHQLPVQPTVPAPEPEPEPEQLPENVEYYIASYPYQSVEQGDLTFNAGDILIIVKKEGDWWTGKIGDNIGIFPSNYVQKYDAAQVRVLFIFLFVISWICLLCIIYIGCCN